MHQLRAHLCTMDAFHETLSQYFSSALSFILHLVLEETTNRIYPEMEKVSSSSGAITTIFLQLCKILFFACAFKKLFAFLCAIFGRFCMILSFKKNLLLILPDRGNAGGALLFFQEFCLFLL